LRPSRAMAHRHVLVELVGLPISRTIGTGVGVAVAKPLRPERLDERAFPSHRPRRSRETSKTPLPQAGARLPSLSHVTMPAPAGGKKSSKSSRDNRIRTSRSRRAGW
jgi:hypothetical protein